MHFYKSSHIILTTVKSNISYFKPANHNIYLWRHANLQGMSKDVHISLQISLLQILLKLPLKNIDLISEKLDMYNEYVCAIYVSSTYQSWINHTLKQLRRHKQLSYNKPDQLIYIPAHWLYYNQSKKEMQKNAVNPTTSTCQISYVRASVLWKWQKEKTFQLYKITPHCFLWY